MLRAAGLDVRPVGRSDGDIHELVVTNPQFPTWGRVVVDREGFMEWDYWGHIGDDAGAADIAAVIIAIMGTHPGADADRYGTRPTFQPVGEHDRSHP
jgi:hypothetical protein